MNTKFKRKHLFEIEIICNIVNAITVHLDKFNVSWLNKSNTNLFCFCYFVHFIATNKDNNTLKSIRASLCFYFFFSFCRCLAPVTHGTKAITLVRIAVKQTCTQTVSGVIPWSWFPSTGYDQRLSICLIEHLHMCDKTRARELDLWPVI